MSSDNTGLPDSVLLPPTAPSLLSENNTIPRASKLSPEAIKSGDQNNNYQCNKRDQNGF